MIKSLLLDLGQCHCHRIYRPLFPFQLSPGRGESRDLLWLKSFTGYMKSYEDFVKTEKVDWVIRGDDDTFFVRAVGR